MALPEVIGAGEVDAKSPLTAILFGKVRDWIIALTASVVAGDGLTGGSGSALAVNPDNSTIEIVSDQVRVKLLGAAIPYTALKMTQGYDDLTNGSSSGDFYELHDWGDIGTGFCPFHKFSGYTASITNIKMGIIDDLDTPDLSESAYMYYGFTKGDTNQCTMMIYFNYLTASRDEPVVWMLRHKPTNHFRSLAFRPECTGGRHPFARFYKGLDPKWEILCLEIKDSPELKAHLWEGLKAGELNVLQQVRLGILLGYIKLEEAKADHEKHLDKKAAPCLYDKDARVVKFTFTPPE